MPRKIIVMEDKNLSNSEELNSNSENVSTENITTVQEKEPKLSAADLLLQKIANKKADLTQAEETVKTKATEKEVVAEVILENTANEPVAETVKAAVEENTSNTTEEEAPQNQIPKETSTVPNDNKAEAIVSEPAEEKAKEIEEKIPDYSLFTREALTEALNDLVEKEEVNKIKDQVEIIKSNFYQKLKNEVQELKDKFEADHKSDDDDEEKPVFEKAEDLLEATFKSILKKYRAKKSEYAAKFEKMKAENLQAKYKIIEELKDLINKPEAFNDTYNEFKELQKKWREVGLVPQNEVRKLWDNYNYHVENFYNYIKINKELRDLDLKKNMKVKIQLCESAEKLMLEPLVVKAFKSLQDLHDLWRAAGPVPRDKKDELWDRFRAATVYINKRHQDHFEALKGEQEQNLKAKELLCEKAEEYAEEKPESHKAWKVVGDNIIELQKMWKGIGYAPKKHNQEIYLRFRAACDKVFSKKREFYKQENTVRENNMQLKNDLCVQAESLMESQEWKKTTEIYKTLQQDWKKIGQVARKDSEAVWQRFRKACNTFFDAKSAFFKSRHTSEETNLNLKKELIEEINNFEPEDMGKGDMEKLKDLQNRWSEIGFVPFKVKDEIYSEYREAIDAQFSKLRSGGQQRENHNFKQRVKNMKGSNRGANVYSSEIDKLRTKIETTKSEISQLENNLGFFANSKNADSMIQGFKDKIAKLQAQAEQFNKQIIEIKVAQRAEKLEKEKQDQEVNAEKNEEKAD